jgi:hypothetical protein
MNIKNASRGAASIGLAAAPAVAFAAVATP